jgi:hypothetical protein
MRGDTAEKIGCGGVVVLTCADVASSRGQRPEALRCLRQARRCSSWKQLDDLLTYSTPLDARELCKATGGVLVARRRGRAPTMLAFTAGAAISAFYQAGILDEMSTRQRAPPDTM